MPIDKVIKLRRGEAGDWTTVDPILLEGEIGVETDTLKAKYGDGTTAWSSLGYITSWGVSGAGEANTASNSGSGDGLFISKLGIDLRFKSLTAGENITLTPSGTEINISSSVDGAKLDGIEALADVTDEANVVSALDGATLTAVTATATDKVIVQDDSDSDNIKTVTAQSIADLAASVSEEEATLISAVAAGNTLGLQQSLLANAGQPALTVLAVGYTTSGKVQGVSLGDGNVIEVFADGADYNSGTVLYREFMSFGEPICFTGLANGAIVTSSQGFYGFCECADAGNEGPMPLLSYGLSFKSTFLFAFRDSDEFGVEDQDRGFIHIVNGPLDNIIKLTFGDGTIVQSQENIALTPWEHTTVETDGNVEYILSGTQPMMACIHSRMSNLDGVTGTNGHADARLVMPLTNDGITWPRNGFVSAPYDNTAIDYYVQDNAEGDLGTGSGVSPGSPQDFDISDGNGGTGANDSFYRPSGATRVLATGLMSAFSGADGSGVDASPMLPTSAMSQVVAQPFYIADAGDGSESSVSIASPYVGTAKIYSWNDATKALDLEYTLPLNRNGVTVASKTDQLHPTAGQVSNETVTGTVALVGQLDAGVIISDVPMTVIVQNSDGALMPTIRSQGGATTSGIQNQEDETLSLGLTPDTIKAEIVEGTDGILYKRVIGATGTESWAVA